MPADPGRFTAIVLAGRRAGVDPLAEAHGVTWKCLVPVAGVAMLERVLDALAGSAAVGRLVVAIDVPEALERLDVVRALRASGRLVVVEGGATPSLSVLAVLDALPDALPALITTADHPLLTPGIVDWFCERAGRADADVLAGLTPADVLLAAHPEARRTFLHFRGERYTGSNLFAVRTQAGLAAVRFWRRVEQMRKRPWRLIRAFGVMPLVRYLLGQLELADAMRIASRRIGARVDAVVCPFPEAGIDVDKALDLELAERILLERHPNRRDRRGRSSPGSSCSDSMN